MTSYFDQVYRYRKRCYSLFRCLHDQNKSGFFGGPAFIQPHTAIWKVFKKPWLAGKKPAL